MIRPDHDSFDLAHEYAEKYKLKQEKMFEILERIENIKKIYFSKHPKLEKSPLKIRNAISSKVLFKLNIELGNNKSAILALKEGENLKKYFICIIKKKISNDYYLIEFLNVFLEWLTILY